MNIAFDFKETQLIAESIGSRLVTIDRMVRGWEEEIEKQMGTPESRENTSRLITIYLMDRTRLLDLQKKVDAQLR